MSLQGRHARGLLAGGRWRYLGFQIRKLSPFRLEHGGLGVAEIVEIAVVYADDIDAKIHRAIDFVLGDGFSQDV